MKTHLLAIIMLISVRIFAFAEDIRLQITDMVEVSKDRPSGVVLSLGAGDAVAINIERDVRFIRGVELELTAPQAWLANHGGLAVAVYAAPGKSLSRGMNDMEAKQLRMDILAGNIQTVYQIPVKKNHGIRGTPYTALLPETLPGDFPLVFRMMPVVRDLGKEVSAMRFQLSVKPILNDEGAVRINLRYPQNLQNKPVIMIVDNKILEYHPQEELIFKEGEHHLMLISSDYRNESRRFIIEQGKTIELSFTLQDLTPLVIFEAPESARIFLDNVRFQNTGAPKPVEPGLHEVKVQLSDYTIIKSLSIQKGKTYRVSFTVDLLVFEE